MKLDHEIYKCKNCGEFNEIFTEEKEVGISICTKCQFENHLDDEELQVWTEEW